MRRRACFAHGKYLYGSNRGRDSIVCFLSDESTGRLTYRGHTPTEGQVPRNFAIDPVGNFLLVANQKMHNIVTFKIDPIRGNPFKTRDEIGVPMPMCVKFAYLMDFPT